MSNEEELLLPLKTILVNLKVIANKVRTKLSFCQKMKNQLKNIGYDWFGDPSSLKGEDLKEQVMKVLAVAVNEAIKRKVDVVGENKKVVTPELRQLLKIDERKSLNDYFKSSVSKKLASMSSPLDMAKHLKKIEGIQWLVVNIFQYQFDIRWNTLTINGDPADYTFYQFCDNENTTEFLKHDPRQAHVKATLYKECRRKSVNDLRRITKENLCPTVYIKIARGWKSWRADKDEFCKVRKNNKTLSLIDPSILKFITENADKQSRKDESLKNSLKNPTLYWAVLDDKDFIPETLKLKKIGRTQVYVGRAINGIQGRWTKDGKNHCEMMKKCLDNVCAMTTYDPSRLEGISLVDARLALAKVRREHTALFVIKTFGKVAEKAEIAKEKAKELRKVKEFLRVEKTARRRTKLEAKVAKRQEELDKAIADTKRSKSKAEAPLTRAERLHLDGKRVNDPSENIIPYDDDMTWTPKDMKYGMNNK